MDHQLDPMDPTTVRVDFHGVDADGRLATQAEGLTVGMFVQAADDTGNRCRAKVSKVDGAAVELELVLDSFRVAGE